MWQEILKRLTSERDGDRSLAWHELHERITKEQLKLSLAQIEQLLDELANERVDQVRRKAVVTMLGLSLREQGLLPQKPVAHVADWFWSPLRHPSAVIRGFDVTRRRDEDAVIELARSLPRQDFPEAVFMRIPLDAPHWEETLRFKPHAVCVS